MYIVPQEQQRVYVWLGEQKEREGPERQWGESRDIEVSWEFKRQKRKIRDSEYRQLYLRVTP